MKSRIIIVFFILMSLWGILILRAGFLQFAPDVRLSQLESRQFQTMITLQSRRGAIVDRKGRDLAVSAKSFSLFADPKLLVNKKSVSQKIAKELGKSPESIYNKVKDSNKRFVWLGRFLSKEKADNIKAFRFPGISFVEEFKRIYPNEDLLSSILGMVGYDGQGLEGLEYQYESHLSSDKKKVIVKRDARGRPLIVDGMIFTENPDGSEIKLTIDSEIQHELEKELGFTVKEFDADQAFGVVLEANTSAIVAMGAYPDFDANQSRKMSVESRRIKSITDAFEPGSTMKAFTIAAALKEKIIAPNTKYELGNGVLKIGKHVIHEAETNHRWKYLTVNEILAYSSNVGASKIALDLGSEILKKTLEDFGFGSKTGIDLPGENKGILLPLPWRAHLLSNISFGHGISATPLQIANAYAALTNGGLLRKPYLVQSIRNSETGKLIENSPQELRRVLPAEVSAQMRLMLTGVTAEGGTGVKANVSGFIIGGKTGTAQKVNSQGKGYLDKAYISSFVGFIPATDPRYVIYIALDYPKKNSYYGSQVAAPVFSRLATYVARSEGMMPQLISEKNLVPLAHKEEEKKTSEVSVKINENMDANSKTNKNREESLEEKKSQTENTKNNIVLEEKEKVSSEENQFDKVPFLKKLSLREVLRKLQGKNVTLQIYGQGTVSEVIPEEGSPLSGEKPKIKVILKE